MPLIKDGQIIENHWRHVDDESTLPEGKVTVSFHRWNEQKQQLLERPEGQTGIRLNGDDPLETLEPELSRFPVIALEFPSFTDGRCFSFARTLRDRFHYRGEIRAVGDFLRDQVHFLSRVGFDAFEFQDREQAEQALRALKDFSVHYQVSSDQSAVVRHRLSGETSAS